MMTPQHPVVPNCPPPMRRPEPTRASRRGQAPSTTRPSQTAWRPTPASSKARAALAWLVQTPAPALLSGKPARTRSSAPFTAPASTAALTVAPESRAAAWRSACCPRMAARGCTWSQRPSTPTLRASAARPAWGAATTAGCAVTTPPIDPDHGAVTTASLVVASRRHVCVGFPVGAAAERSTPQPRWRKTPAPCSSRHLPRLVAGARGRRRRSS